MAAKVERVTLDVGGREVSVSNPHKLYFPEAGITKLELVRYYLAVADGALRGAGGRPNVLVRYANGIHGEFFYQKPRPDARHRVDRDPGGSPRGPGGARRLLARRLAQDLGLARDPRQRPDRLGRAASP